MSFRTKEEILNAVIHYGADYQLDQIEAGSSVLLNNQIDQLVSAMATYDIPLGAGQVIPQSVKDDLSVVLAQTWQAAQ